MINGRKVLYTEDRVRALFARMRDDLSAMSFRHACAVADLERELAQTRADFEALKLTVRARVRAEQELDRLRAIRDATTATRDFGTRLH
jgi:hypothetical protein